MTALRPTELLGLTHDPVGALRRGRLLIRALQRHPDPSYLGHPPMRRGDRRRRPANPVDLAASTRLESVSEGSEEFFGPIADAPPQRAGLRDDDDVSDDTGAEHIVSLHCDAKRIVVLHPEKQGDRGDIAREVISVLSIVCHDVNLGRSATYGSAG